MILAGLFVQLVIINLTLNLFKLVVILSILNVLHFKQFYKFFKLKGRNATSNFLPIGTWNNGSIEQQNGTNDFYWPIIQ